MTIAGGADAPFFDLERLISRQKVAPAAPRVMRSTLAISFQLTSATRAKHGSTLIRKIAASLRQTPVGELRTMKFHRIAPKLCGEQTGRTKMSRAEEGDSRHTGV